MRLFVFERKNPVEWMSASTLVGIGVREIGRRRIPREQRGRHHVDALVGGLRRQDRRDEQLVRIAVVERALRVGIHLRSRSHDVVGARFRTSGTGHGGHGTLAPVCTEPSVAARRSVPRSPTSRRRSPRSTHAARAADGHPSLGDAVWRDLDASARRLGGLPASDDARRVRARRPQRQLLAAALGARHRRRIPTRATARHARTLLDAAAIAHVARPRRRARSCCGVRRDPSDDDALLARRGFAPGARRSSRCACRSRSPSSPEVARPASTVRTFEPGRDEARVARGQQPRVRQSPRAGRLDRRRRSQRRMAEPWFDPSLFLLAFDADGLAGFNWLKIHDAHGRDPRLGEIFVIGVDPRTQGTGLGRALAIAGLARASHERGITTGMLFVAADNAPRAAALPVARLRRCTAPTARTSATVAARMTTRYDARPRRARRRSLAESASRATAPGSSTTGCATQRRPLEELTNLPARAARPARRRAAARARRRSPMQHGRRRHDGEVALARRTTARRSRPCSCATRPRDGVRLVAGRVRDGLHVLRDRPGRLRTPPRRRARSSSRSCAPQHASPQRVSQRRLHGHGRAARQRRRGARGVSSACTTTSASRPATSRSRPSASCPGCAGSREFALPVTLAVSLHAPDDALRERARAAEPPLPDRRRARRRARATPTARAGASRSSTRASPASTTIPHQADALAGRLTGLPRRRAREPDPAQPDRRVPPARPPTTTRIDDLRGTPAGRRRPGDASAATGAPTSTPPAASCAPGQPNRRRGRPNGVRAVRENGTVNDIGGSTPTSRRRSTSARHPLLHRRRLRPALRRLGRVGPRASFIIVGLAAGGFGIANEKKWGYTLAVVGRGRPGRAALFARSGFGRLTNISVLISFMFDAALVALLLHPMSRDYQRIWFK